MYEETFGTDWDHLTEREAIRRAFGLGVMKSFGEPLAEEYERVLDTAENAYERSMIQTAFETGAARGRSVEADDAETVWSNVIGGDGELTDITDADATDSGGGTPAAITQPDLLDAPGIDDRPSNVDLPEYLFRTRDDDQG